MISLQHLKESIYKDCYFSEAPGSLTVHNEDKAAAGVLSSVEMTTQGTFISLSNKILKEGSNIFQKEDIDAGRISYRRDCDGLCLLEVGGRKILLVIEVKKKGFEQIVSSYVKVRSILLSIEGYNPAEYEEMGLLVSYPPTGDMNIPVRSMIGIKKAVIAPSYLDQLNAKNATALRVDSKVTLDLSEYHVDACHVNRSLYNPTLLVKHVAVEDQKESDTFSLDKYL